jgi:hypothetical protein
MFVEKAGLCGEQNTGVIDAWLWIGKNDFAFLKSAPAWLAARL